MKYNDPIYQDREQGFDGCVDEISALKRVEINCVELCNRKCVFCPRVDPEIYPNRDLHMTHDTIHNLCLGLEDVTFSGRVTFSGMGEPLLHQDIYMLVSEVRAMVTNVSRVQVITNGDKLTSSVVSKLIDSGVDRIEVNLYDGPHQIENVEACFSHVNPDICILRHHYHGPEKTYGLIVNNRAGAVDMGGPPAQGECYLPFYKLVIDWNGDVLLCSQDWLHESKLSLNINEMNIKDIWLSKQLNNYRENLKRGDRCDSPCVNCNVNGTVYGKQAFDVFK